MRLNILILFILILFILNCSDKGPKIEFKKWEEAIIEKNAIPIAENSIAGYKTGVFQSKFLIEDLKKGYISKGYKEDSVNPYFLKKDNISVTLINLDNQKTNIMIRIEPK